MIKTERFNAQYLPFEASNLMSPGNIVAGKNLRKYGFAGGWVARKGSTLLNTTTYGQHLRILAQYQNPKQLDYHLLVTTGDGNLLDKTDLTQEATLSTELFDDFNAGPGVGWAAVVGEDIVMTDGDEPLIWGGATPFCDGFLIYDGQGSYIDATSKVTDGTSGTSAILPSHASMEYYVLMKERGSGIHLDLGSTVNNNAVTPTVYAWRAGAWAAVSDQVDGTDGTETHDQDGTISWTVSTSDEKRVLANRHGYWYRVAFSGAMDAVHVVACRVTRAVQRMTNKWDGEFRYPAGVLFYDQSAGQYIDKLGLLSNTSEEQYLDMASSTTSDYLYIKTIDPPLGFGFGLVTAKANSANAQVDQVEYWNGSEWLAITALTDKTLDEAADSSFAQAGAIWIDQATYPMQKRLVGGDQTAGYWCRISWDASLGTDCQLSFVVYAAAPDRMPYADGVVEFKGRAVYWGNEDYPNRLVYSPYNKPDTLSDVETKYSYPFGGYDPIKAVGVLGDYLIVLKERGVYLMDSNFGVPIQVTGEVGIASPKSLVIAETGDRTLRSEERIPVAIWQDIDGVYKASNLSNIQRISDQVYGYFDPNSSNYIIMPYIKSWLEGFYTPLDSLYHLILPIERQIELVYSVRDAEWYPPWERAIPLLTGKTIKGTDGAYKVVGTGGTGFLMLLDVGLHDHTTANVDAAVETSLRTRAIYCANEEVNSITGYLRELWTEFTMDGLTYLNEFGELPLDFSTGTPAGIGINIYVNREPTAIALTPEVKTPGLDFVVPMVNVGERQIYCFQLECTTTQLNLQVLFTSFTYFIKEYGTYGR